MIYAKNSNLIGDSGNIMIMDPILNFTSTAYIEAQNLLPLLSDYTNPHDFLARLVKKGDLIRLKNGFYVIAEKIKNAPVPYEQLSNLLHGPSYLSFEWALSHYGMIPEGVYVITSASSARSKIFKTPLGTFDYTYLGHRRFAIGIDQKENSAGRFLIATPEKALVDLVHLKTNNLQPKDLLIDLIEGRRIEEYVLKNLNKSHLLEIGENYRSRTVNNLIHALGIL
jgi:hypothetical protein